MMIRTDYECRIIWIIWEIYSKETFGHNEMSTCWKEYSGYNYGWGACEWEILEKAWVSWWDAMNTFPEWLCVDGLTGASACGCRNSDLKAAGWTKENSMLRSSMWKSVSSLQALDTPASGEYIRTKELRLPRACARLSVHADTFKGCTTQTILRKAVLVACSLM